MAHPSFAWVVVRGIGKSHASRQAIENVDLSKSALLAFERLSGFRQARR
jgi:hypothetical protein